MKNLALAVALLLPAVALAEPPGLDIWSRNHPEASRELMRYPAGLHWAGTHLYQSYWDMKSGQ